MATLTKLIYTANNSAAMVKDYCWSVEAAFIAGGWQQTGDSGQFVISSYAGGGGGSSTNYGYQIWRMADSLSTTYPCYVKFEYGNTTSTGSGAAGGWITIGSGSDGAGNITGVYLARFQLTNGNGQGNTSQTSPCYYSAASNRIAYCYLGNSTTYFQAWGIERTKDTSGADTGEGFLVIAMCAPTYTFGCVVCRFVRAAGNSPANSTTIGATAPSGTTWSDSGGVFGVYPIKYFNGQPSNPGLNWAVYMDGDTSAGSPININIYGRTRQMIPLGSSATFNIRTIVHGNVNTALMMIWE